MPTILPIERRITFASMETNRGVTVAIFRTYEGTVASDRDSGKTEVRYERADLVERIRVHEARRYDMTHERSVLERF